jgi:membrane protein YdbS with pleckstrin-like domain
MALGAIVLVIGIILALAGGIWYAYDHFFKQITPPWYVWGIGILGVILFIVGIIMVAVGH